MDLIRIGTYIAGKRKALGMTQRQLAELLGMSDKSVSKWERGVCLPDVSVYAELCTILGISINEFLAGEDIAREDLPERSEGNLIGVTVDSKGKQLRLKRIIALLAALTIAVLTVLGVIAYRELAPCNRLEPLAPESIEMETARLLAGSDGAYIYRFTTTDRYDSLCLHIAEYRSGERTDIGDLELEFDVTGSPRSGEILIVPDHDERVIRVVIAAEGTKVSTEIPILEGAEEPEHYGRVITGLQDGVDIRYNREQGLLALEYGKNGVWSEDFDSTFLGEADTLRKNEYTYLFSCTFRKNEKE